VFESWHDVLIVKLDPSAVVVAMLVLGVLRLPDSKETIVVAPVQRAAVAQDRVQMVQISAAALKVSLLQATLRGRDLRREFVLREEEAISALNESVEVKRVSKFACAVDLHHLSRRADSKAIYVYL